MGGQGPLTSVNNAVILHWCSKRKDHKNTVLTQFYFIIGYQLLSWFFDKTNNLGNASAI